MKTCSGYWPEPGVPCLRMLRDGVCPKQSDPHHGYVREGPPDDPRWDWVNIQTMSDPAPVWIKGACRHVSPITVDVADPLSGGRIPVAKICPDCDQETWNWADDDLPEPNGFERWAYAPSAGSETEEDLAALETFGPVPLKGLHLTSSPGAEWWRQLPEGASERDVATINGKPIKVNQDGILIYANREPVYVAGGFIRPGPARRPFWHRALENWWTAQLAVWNWIKSEAYWLWVPTLAAGGVAEALVENGVWK